MMVDERMMMVAKKEFLRKEKMSSGSSAPTVSVPE
jgi:hypothetical protein